MCEDMVDRLEPKACFQCSGVFLPESQIKMAYKPKSCPACGIVHTKRGEYCSRSCGNKKKHTAETKAKIAEGKREWLNSGNDAAEVEKHNFISKRNHGDPDPVPPQVHGPLGINQYVEDGDLWTEM